LSNSCVLDGAAGPHCPGECYGGHVIQRPDQGRNHPGPSGATPPCKGGEKAQGSARFMEALAPSFPVMPVTYSRSLRDAAPLVPHERPAIGRIWPLAQPIL